MSIDNPPSGPDVPSSPEVPSDPSAPEPFAPHPEEPLPFIDGLEGSPSGIDGTPSGAESSGVDDQLTPSDIDDD